MGLDIIFREQRQPFFDSILKATINSQTNLVTSYYRDGDSLVKNHTYFNRSSEKAGYINLNLEGQNTVIREFIGLKPDIDNGMSFAHLACP